MQLPQVQRHGHISEHHLEYFYYITLGAFAGFLAGLLGVGGGLVIVPVLATLFVGMSIGGELVMHLAVGTSLATIVFTSLSSIWAHHKKGAVRWREVAQLTPGIVLGAWVGAAIADVLPTAALRFFFGVFELGVAIQLSLNIKAQPKRRLPGTPGMIGAGSLIGGVSAIVGIGGGTMTVPFLVWCNVVMREAVATAAACGLPIAVAGSVGFVIAGWNEPASPPLSLGYVYVPALLSIAGVSMLFAPLGARLAHWLPADKLKKVFAMMLYALAVYMLWGVWFSD